MKDSTYITIKQPTTPDAMGGLSSCQKPRPTERDALGLLNAGIGADYGPLIADIVRLERIALCPERYPDELAARELLSRNEGKVVRSVRLEGAALYSWIARRAGVGAREVREYLKLADEITAGQEREAHV